MVFNFRKIASVIASAVMIGSTVAIAAAEIYPAPFVKGGNADVAVVIGSRAQPTDMVALNDITISLGDALAKQTATVTGGTSTGASSTGGDSVFLSSTARKIYYGDAINADKSSLSNSHLPTLLANGKVIDLRGTEYTYQQTIAVGSRTVAYGRSGSNFDDPTIYVDLSTSATTAPLYNYTLTLNKNLNVSDPTNVQGQKINILGVDYVIGSDSSSTVLVLNGAGQTISLAGGDTANFTIGGVAHTVELRTTTGATTARIVVDGVSRDVSESSTYAFAGGMNIYIKDVTHPSFAGDLRSVDLIVGANTITLTTGQAVAYGPDSTTIQGTRATITSAGGGLISGFSVSVAAPDSANDAISEGGYFVDPVFGGMKVQFGGATPSLNDTSRGTVVVDTDNNRFATVKFTPARGGTEKTIKYAYDNNSADATVQALLAYSDIDSDDYRIHVLEGENAKVNDYIVVNKGDQVGQGGTIVKVSTIQVTDDTSASNDYVTFDDVFTGDTTKISLTNGSAGYTATTQTLGGVSGYTVSSSAVTGGALENLRVNVTWNSGARALFPRIRLKDGGWVTFLAQTVVPNSTSVIFPDGLTTLGTTGTTVFNAITATNNTATQNGIVWTVQNGTSPTVTGIANCVFNSTYGPAILYQEDKKWNDATYGDFICIPLTTEGTTTVKMAISTPVIYGTNSGFVTHRTVDNTASAVDKFGTLVTYDTADDNTATLKTVGSQMFTDVLFTSDNAVVTPGTGGSTVGGTVKSLGTPTVMDTQAASLTTKNLIVIGGSCVNSVAASLLGSSTPICGTDFTTKTGVESGQFIIKTYSWGTGKVATLVAGFNAEDTTNAATYLHTQASVEITAGKGVKVAADKTVTPITTTTNSSG
jgi:hypothetical protein